MAKPPIDRPADLRIVPVEKGFEVRDENGKPYGAICKTKAEAESRIRVYWDKVLISHGLSMGRAARPRIWINRGTPEQRYENRLTFVGSSKNLADIEEKQAGLRVPRDGRRVEPQGHPPDR